MRKIFLLTLILFCLPLLTLATDCPFGLVNDPTPGICTRYVDSDGNDICDLSQIPLEPFNSSDKNSGFISEEELKQKTVAEMAEIYNVDGAGLATALGGYLGKDVKAGDSLLALHDNEGLCTGVAASIAASLQAGKSANDLSAQELISGQELKTKKVYEAAEIYGISENEFANALASYLGHNIKLSDDFQTLHDNYGLEPSRAKEIAAQLAGASGGVAEIQIADIASTELTRLPRYKFIDIAAAVILLYSLTYILALKKRITILTHRRLWNIVLLFSFLGSVLLGLLLIIRINWGWYLVLPFNMLYWHVEFGTVMAVVTVFHIINHWRYFSAMLKPRKK